MKISDLVKTAFLLSSVCLLPGCSSTNEKGYVEYTLTKPSLIWGNGFKAYKNTTSVVDPIADLRIYQVMVESFQNGDDTINYNTGYGPSDHKGDLQGIINALPYIKSLNMNAIWLTPVFESAPENDPSPSMLDATGYYTRNYYKVDRRFGDENKLKELVDKAHSLGLYVILDGVFGHFRKDLENTSPMGNKITMTDKCLGGGMSVYPPLEGTSCTDFNDGGASMAYINEVASYYIRNYKIDGWRLDQAYQIPVKQLKELKKTIEDTSKDVTYKNSAGDSVHPLGYVVGEYWTDNRTMAIYGYGSDDDPVLDSTFDFGLRYALVQALAVEEWEKRNNSAFRITEGLSYDDTTLPSHAYPNLMITNHDLLRFADLVQRAGYDDTIDERVKLALSYLAVVHSGPITHYYGEEIGQEVPDYAKRVETMGFRDDHVARDNGKIKDFTQEEQQRADLFAYLMKLRASHGAISNGRMDILTVKKDLLAVRKTFSGDDTFIYLMNLNPQKTLQVNINPDLTSGITPVQLIGKGCTNTPVNDKGEYVSIIKPLSFEILQSGSKDKECHM